MLPHTRNLLLDLIDCLQNLIHVCHITKLAGSKLVQDALVSRTHDQGGAKDGAFAFHVAVHTGGVSFPILQISAEPQQAYDIHSNESC